MNVPTHVAIILDGNGRWAKAKGLPRTAGHIKGADNVEDICQAASDLGIKYITMYAFSTENWKRPQDEVTTLMGLLRQYIKKCIKMAKKKNMSVKILGDISKLEEDIQNDIRFLEEQTKDCDKLHLQIAINYGGRDEIRRAVTNIAKQVKDGEVNPEDISEEMISQNLDTKDIPDPDLMIRTSGEQRISNYLLWQLAYAEFYFTPVPWPDFNKDELMKAVEAYNQRDRRYGLVK